MHENAKPTAGQGARIIGFLKRLRLRYKVIAAVVVVFVIYILVSIPGDKSELRARQDRVEIAQTAYDLANPAVAPTLETMMVAIEEAEIDPANRMLTRLSSAVTAFNRTNSSVASRFTAVVTFHKTIHALLDGPDAVPELDTPEFRALVVDMDTTFSVALIALMELNVKVDEYNGYHNKISARFAGAFYGLPSGFDDPVPSRSRLDSESLDLDQ
jgi:hypothetical protein